MRKKTRKPVSKPTTKVSTPALPLNKETIRKLGSDELGEVATGLNITCPDGQSWTQTMNTKTPPDTNEH